MFLLRRPDDRLIGRFLERARGSSLTYEPVGLSMLAPTGYNVDEIRMKIGEGPAAFGRARRALDSWQPLRLGWVDARPATASPEIGSHVAVIARHVGFWSLNACRVVQRFPSGPDDGRYGFAYGTLADHAESGEELFAVELDDSDGTVWYQIRAVSRPRAPLARLGHPVARALQARFRRDSARVMAASIR